MTDRAGHLASPPGSEKVLLVAVCGGDRCRALHRLHQPAEPDAGPISVALRDAVRDQPNAVLLTTNCLGACHLGALAAVGWAMTSPAGQLTWTTAPAAVTEIQRPERTAQLTAWLQSGATDPATPPTLKRGVA